MFDPVRAPCMTAPTAARRRALACAAAAVWGAAWWLPWAAALHRLPFLRVWLAVLVWCVPGLALDVLLRRRGPDVGERLPVAFVLSLALVSTLGLAGRIAGTWLATIDVALLLAGASLAGAATHELLAGRATLRAGDGARGPLWSAAVLAVALLAGAALCTAPPVAVDDFTHGARIAAFQQLPLGFGRLAFPGATSIAPRYWLALWPIGEGLLATHAGTTGLQLLALVAPALAVVALLAVRGLARALGLPRELASLAVLAHVAALALLDDRLQPGRAFFGRLGEDKFLAILLIGPVACTLLVTVLERASRERVGAAVLAWIALALTHPTSLGMTALVALAFCAVDFAARRSRTALAAAAIVVATTAPVAALRLVPHPQYRHVHFSVADSEEQGELTEGRTGRVDVSAGGWVGVAARARPPALLAFGGVALVVAAARWRRGPLPRFVLAALVVPAVAIVPVTGWLLGLLVTPFHLWRTLGLIPFGLASVLVVEPLLARRDGRMARATRAGVACAFVTGCCAALLSVAAGDARALRILRARTGGWVTPTGDDVLVMRCIGKYERATWRIADLRAVRRAVDTATSARPVVLGDRCINDLLPSISARATVVAFRLPIEMLNHGDFTLDEATRIWDTQLELVDGHLAADAAVRFLEERGVDLVVTSRSAAWLDAIPTSMLPRRAIATSGPLRVYRVGPAAIAPPPGDAR